MKITSFSVLLNSVLFFFVLYENSRQRIFNNNKRKNTIFFRISIKLISFETIEAVSEYKLLQFCIYIKYNIFENLIGNESRANLLRVLEFYPVLQINEIHLHASCDCYDLDKWRPTRPLNPTIHPSRPLLITIVEDRNSSDSKYPIE